MQKWLFCRSPSEHDDRDSSGNRKKGLPQMPSPSPDKNKLKSRDQISESRQVEKNHKKSSAVIKETNREKIVRKVVKQDPEDSPPTRERWAWLSEVNCIQEPNSMKLDTLAVAEALLTCIRKCQRTAFFWAIVQWEVVIPYRRFRTTFQSQSSRVLLEFLTLADGTDRLSQNIDKELTQLAAE